MFKFLKTLAEAAPAPNSAIVPHYESINIDPAISAEAYPIHQLGNLPREISAQDVLKAARQAAYQKEQLELAKKLAKHRAEQIKAHVGKAQLRSQHSSMISENQLALEQARQQYLMNRAEQKAQVDGFLEAYQSASNDFQF